MECVHTQTFTAHNNQLIGSRETLPTKRLDCCQECVHVGQA